MQQKLGLVAVAMMLSLLASAAAARTADTQKSAGPWIGVYSQKIDRDLKEAFNLDGADGVVIVDVAHDSPADEAGLRRKDIIISFNGKKVTSPDLLADYVQETHSGDSVVVVYSHRGEQKTATVVVGRRPREERDLALNIPAPPAVPMPPMPPMPPKSLNRIFTYSSMSDSYIGVGISDLTKQLGEYFGVKNGEGVLVTEVFKDSPAEKAGLAAGDIIVLADGKAVAETVDLQDIIGEKNEGDKLAIGYIRRGARSEATVEVAKDSGGRNAFMTPDLGKGFFDSPKFRVFRRSLDNDNGDYFNMDEYHKTMEEYKKQLDEMREELRDLRSKIE